MSRSVCPTKGTTRRRSRSIRAGLPLFVEKPLVFDLAEADSLLDEAARRGLFFGLDFNHRYARPVELAKAAVDAGDLGPLSLRHVALRR